MAILEATESAFIFNIPSESTLLLSSLYPNGEITGTKLSLNKLSKI